MTKVSICSWNIQGQINPTGHTFFRKVRTGLLNLDSDIILLQEMTRAEKKLKTDPAFKNYELFIPKFNTREIGENHNVTLSKYPIVRRQEIAFSRFNPKRDSENSTQTDIQIGDQVLRIYNCHFPIFRVGIATRLHQLEHVMTDAQNHAGPVIICGDMNVTIPPLGWKRTVAMLWHQEPTKEMYINGELIKQDERYLFQAQAQKGGFTETFNTRTATWSPFKTKHFEPGQLKLDWFLTKDLTITKSSLGDYISDHRSMNVEIEI